jgi:hypothetical protein
MKTLNFTMRLFKHGGIFLLKLVGCFIGLVSNNPPKNARSEDPDPWQQYHDAPSQVGPNGARTYYDEY